MHKLFSKYKEETFDENLMYFNQAKKEVESLISKVLTCSNTMKSETLKSNMEYKHRFRVFEFF